MLSTLLAERDPCLEGLSLFAAQIAYLQINAAVHTVWTLLLVPLSNLLSARMSSALPLLVRANLLVGTRIDLILFECQTAQLLQY